MVIAEGAAAHDSLAAGLADELGRQGYRAAGIARHVLLLHCLDAWLASESLDFGELTTYQVDRFVQDRRNAAQSGWPSRRGMRPLLAYLRSAGLLPPAPTEHVAATPADRATAAYRRFLTRERSLAASTMENYLRYVDVFLAGLDAPVRADLTRLSAADVTAAIRRQCRARSVGWVKNFATALRSLLRFLFLDGFVPYDLTGSVLSVAGWRHSGLPKALPPENLALLLASCHRQRHAARRDLAILTLMSRLGLRAGEVAALELEDIDWRAGELVVRGKGGRRDGLPLPHDVGEALADYLRGERPDTASRRVFITAIAPRTAISRTTISGVVRCACRRSGIAPVGPHRLRHLAASEMLRGGSSLAEIGQALRHQHRQTTAIYAKVDLAALAQLAMPWPEVSA